MKDNLEWMLKEREKLNNLIDKKAKQLGIQATSYEGGHDDITSTSITGRTVTTGADLKRNTYKTYTGATQAIYRMYNGTMDFGNEFLGSVVDTRVSFIAGGGCTVIAKNKRVGKAISNFLKYNKMLEGSKLFENVGISVMEGKCLLVLTEDGKNDQLKIRSFYGAADPYHIEMEENDNQKIKSATYKSEKKKGADIAKEKYLVFIKVGGTADKVNDTMPRIGKCLTDIENASRIKYDLRYNNHLYGKITPSFKTANAAEAKALNNFLIQTNWEIGKSYCGTAEFKLNGPPPEASETLKTELIIACRIISINTGIPVHWLAWPELMSNRATAENMLEVINAATIKEREIWEEGLTELVLKAGRLGYEKGSYGFKNINLDKEEFEIKLPLISLAALKQLQETWIPLGEMGYISKDSVRNKIPGINPLQEKEMIEAEKNERVNNIMNKFGNDFTNNNDEHGEEITKEESSEETKTTNEEK